jgi:hypothetical protein
MQLEAFCNLQQNDEASVLHKAGIAAVQNIAGGRHQDMRIRAVQTPVSPPHGMFWATDKSLAK